MRLVAAVAGAATRCKQSGNPPSLLLQRLLVLSPLVPFRLAGATAATVAGVAVAVRCESFPCCQAPGSWVHTAYP